MIVVIFSILFSIGQKPFSELLICTEGEQEVLIRCAEWVRLGLLLFSSRHRRDVIKWFVIWLMDRAS